MTRMRYRKRLAKHYPPSEPCACEMCLGYCVRPGWWEPWKKRPETMAAGYGPRMMLENCPRCSFGVLSPAFKDCEGTFALKNCATRGCTFLTVKRCELHGTGYQPLECRFCHHDRPGLGLQCHADIEKDWNTPAGRALVVQWSKQNGVWARLSLFGLEKLKS